MVDTTRDLQATHGAERLLRPGEVALTLSVSRRTVYCLIRRGLLRACRVGLGGGALRVHPADLQQYVMDLRGLNDRQHAEPRA